MAANPRNMLQKFVETAVALRDGETAVTYCHMNKAKLVDSCGRKNKGIRIL
jgi:hypothetical protein